MFSIITIFDVGIPVSIKNIGQDITGFNIQFCQVDTLQYSAFHPDTTYLSLQWEFILQYIYYKIVYTVLHREVSPYNSQKSW